MFTYTVADLWSFGHTRPPARAVRKAIFSAHLWLPAQDRQSAAWPVSVSPADVSGKYTDQHHLRAGWLNVRSLANKTDAVKEAINTGSLDVLVLTETWHHTSDDIFLRQVLPDNFAVIDAVRESQPGYGGIAVLYSAVLKCTRVEIPPSQTFEALCIRLTASSSSLLLLSIYRPGSSRVSSALFDELSTLLETLVVHGCPVVVGGDLNVHVEDPSDIHGARLLDLFQSMDMIQHVTLPTHKEGGTLDLVATFSDLAIKNLNVDPPNAVSDHNLQSSSPPDDCAEVHSPSAELAICRQSCTASGDYRQSARQHCAARYCYRRRTVRNLRPHITRRRRPVCA